MPFDSIPFLPAAGLKDIRSSRNGLSSNHGWFYLHCLVSFSSFFGEKLLKEFPEQFKATNQVEENWFVSHLNEEEFLRIVPNKNLEIFKIPKKQVKNSLNNHEYLLVRSCENWKPKTPYTSLTELGYNFYIVKGAEKSSLYNDDDVFSVENYQLNEVENRYMAGYLHNGEDKLVFENKHYWLSRSLEKHGITGEGQIVTIGDTGIDTYHNFFYDKDHEVPFNRTDMSHRKIVRYEALADTTDAVGGHGTHVSGIICGKSWDNMSEASLYNGVAPDAKIYFIDLGVSANPRIILNFNLEKAIKTSEEIGSEIMSNSFGSSVFTEQTILFDTACWKNKNYLIVNSAGNRKGPRTIASFADAENVLTVGNTLSPSSQQIETPENTSYYIVNWSRSYLINLHQLNSDMFYDENKKLIDLQNVSIGTIPIKNGIYVITNTTNLQEEINKAYEASCMCVVFSEKQNISELQNLTISAFKTTDAIIEHLANLTNCSFIMKPTKFRKIEMYTSTSQGPGFSGILKPDISAPGTLISSAQSIGPTSGVTNDTTKATLRKRTGTSMSAPGISGAALLLRQYFVKGYYPTGSENPSDAIKSPTAALIKAALINSAKSLNDSIRTNHWGYGIPNLEKAMGFDGSGNVYIDNVSIAQNESHTYKVKVEEEGQQFSVSLAYTDCPSFYTSARVLTTTINLVVEDSNGSVYPGNTNPDNSDEMYSTMSKVLIPKAPAGEYTIHVICSDYSKLISMEYSLAVNGKIASNKYKRLEEKACPASCSRNGKCVNGRCVCSLYRAGTYCQTEVYQSQFNRAVLMSFKDGDGPCWLVYNVTKGHDYNLYIAPDLNDYHIRFCVAFEKDSVGSKNMKCFLSQISSYSFNITNVPTDHLYIVSYKGMVAGTSSFKLTEINSDQKPSSNTPVTSNTSDKYDSSVNSTITSPLYFWIIIGSLSTVIIILAVLLIVVCYRQRSRKTKIVSSEVIIDNLI